MRIYGITNLNDNADIQQIATDPNNFWYSPRKYIVWYKDWNNEDDPLNTKYYNIVDIQDSGWKIWESDTQIFDCSYTNNVISQDGKGVLEIIYKEGKLIELKYWFDKKDYPNNPDLIKR